MPEDEDTPFRAPTSPEPAADVETVMAVDPTPPSQTLVERLDELGGSEIPGDEDAAAPDPAPPPKKAPAKKAPAKKAPAKKAPAKKAPAKKAAAKKAPAEKAPAMKAAPAPAAAEEAAVVLAAPSPLEPPPPPPAIPSLPPPPPPPLLRPPPPPAPPALRGPTSEAEQVRRWPRALRVLVTLTVLLLAAAAALGAAGLVRSRYQTWGSTSAVRVQAPSSPVTAPDVPAALTRFAVHVPYSSDDVREAAGIPADDMRDDLSAKVVAPDLVVITAQARGAEQAEQLASSAAEALQVWITEEQLKQAATPADRLDSVVARSPSKATLTTESRRLMAGAAGGAAVLVLLLALVVRGRVRKRSRD